MDYILNYKISKSVLGEGKYGRVYKASDRTQKHSNLAVKIINIQEDSNSLSDLLRIRGEIECHQQMDHNNVVRVRDVCRTDSHMYIFLELCDKQSLNELLQNSGGALNVQDALKIMQQISAGVQHMQSKGIVHRDLKTSNILLKDGVAKISDFGFATTLQELSLQQEPRTILGCLCYLSPEILQEQKYSYKSDIWALGILFYKMLVGSTPFRGMKIEEIVYQLNNSEIDFGEKRDYIPIKLKELIKRMLSKDPRTRAGIVEVIEGLEDRDIMQ